jgi:lipooligosaccharide transport system permease protein
VTSAPLRVLEHDLAVYRRTWRGSILVSFISPVLFLAAMGVGLGNLVRNGAGTVDGVSYVRFLAPGLLAATAMQTAVIETTYPIMGKLHWQRIYEAMLATPLAVTDLLIGEIAWLTLRLITVASVFFVVMTVFGTVHTPSAPAAIPATVLTGLAFGTPVLAFSATQTRDSGFAALNRFLVLPLFLLSGPFFPIEQLPRLLEAVAWAFPLAH